MHFQLIPWNQASAQRWSQHTVQDDCSVLRAIMAYDNLGLGSLITWQKSHNWWEMGDGKVRKIQFHILQILKHLAKPHIELALLYLFMFYFPSCSL